MGPLEALFGQNPCFLTAGIFRFKTTREPTSDTLVFCGILVCCLGSEASIRTGVLDICGGVYPKAAGTRTKLSWESQRKTDKGSLMLVIYTKRRAFGPWRRCLFWGFPHLKTFWLFGDGLGGCRTWSFYPTNERSKMEVSNEPDQKGVSFFLPLLGRFTRKPKGRPLILGVKTRVKRAIGCHAWSSYAHSV